MPGRWEGGVGVSLRRFRGKGPGPPLRVAGAAGLTGRDAARGARAAALLSRLWSAGGGEGAESGAGECGRGGGRERGPARAGFVPGPSPPPRPPRGRLCVLFPLVPGAVTPISVRGDLREPGGEGRGRLCGEGRGARGAGRRAAARPRGPGSSCHLSPPPPRLCPCSAVRRASQPPRSGPDPDAPGISQDDAISIFLPAQRCALPSRPVVFLELSYSCVKAICLMSVESIGFLLKTRK